MRTMLAKNLKEEKSCAGMQVSALAIGIKLKTRLDLNETVSYHFVQLGFFFFYDSLTM